MQKFKGIHPLFIFGLLYSSPVAFSQSIVNPIIDSNQGEIDQVLFSVFEVQVNDCESLSQLKKSKILPFLMKEQVNVCFIPHVNFCKELWAMNGALNICGTIARNDDVLSSRNSLFELTETYTNRRKLDVGEWLARNSLFSGEFRSVLEFKRDTSLIPQLTDGAIQDLFLQLANNPNLIKPSYDKAKGLLEYYEIKSEDLPETNKDDITSFRLYPVDQTRENAWIKRKLRSTELSDLLAEYNVRGGIYYDALQSAVVEEITSGFDSLGLVNGRSPIEVTMLPTVVFDCEMRSVESIDSIRQSLGSWMQDKFHVRMKPDQSYELGIITDSNQSAKDQLLKNWLEDGHNCFQGRLAEQDDALADVQGGNMFVLDDLVFIGEDEFDRYKQNETALVRIGATEQSRGSINEGISNSVFGRNYNKQEVIGIGSTRDHYSQKVLDKKSFQPMYHIDLFFHPLGEVNSVFYALIADAKPFPNSRIANQHGELIDSVNQWIYETKLHFQKQMESLVDSVVWIEIPVAIDYAKAGPEDVPKTHRIASSINGFSERIDDRFNFWASVLEDKDLDSSGFNYEVMLAFEKWNSIINTKPVRESDWNFGYGSDDGLHCKLKVVTRK